MKLELALIFRKCRSACQGILQKKSSLARGALLYVSVCMCLKACLGLCVDITFFVNSPPFPPMKRPGAVHNTAWYLNRINTYIVLPSCKVFASANNICGLLPTVCLRYSTPVKARVKVDELERIEEHDTILGRFSCSPVFSDRSRTFKRWHDLTWECGSCLVT